MTTTEKHLSIVADAKPTRCTLHRAYEADYCPICGTAQTIGGTR